MADRVRGRVVLLAAGVLAVVVAAPLLVSALGISDWRWLAGAAALVAAAAGLPAKLYADKAARRSQRREESARTLTRAALGGGSYRVRDITDPTLLGVHRAVVLDVDGADPSLAARRPAYVRRDRHDEIVAKLVPGCFVLVIGESAAGKTRIAFETLAEALPNHVLVAPESRHALADAVDAVVDRRESVLWLDDLERFLGVDGLTVTDIDRITRGSRHHRVIVATLRIQALDQLDAADSTDEQLGGDRRRVLDQAHRVRLERRFTAAERQRAELLTWDVRIDSALRRADDVGIAEYLAAAPELLDEWLNAWTPGTHPRAAALVTAAIECRRAGFVDHIPTNVVEELHESYLAERGGRKLRPESLAEAWEWATASRPRWGTVALLEKHGTGHVAVFDYLVDHVQHTSTPDDHVPDQIVLTALAHTDAAEANDIGRTATVFDRHMVARMAFARAVELSSVAYGADAPTTLASRHDLALALHLDGDLKRAAAEHQAVLEARTRVLGPDHPDTINSRAHLAHLQATQNDYRHLAAMTRKELATLTRALENTRAVRDSVRSGLPLTSVLGPEHPTSEKTRAVLDLMRHFATSYHERLDMLTPAAGAEHPDILACRDHIANLTQSVEELAADNVLLKILTCAWTSRDSGAQELVPGDE